MVKSNLVIFFLSCISIISCSTNDNTNSLENKDDLLYYPISYDDYWRTYSPKLVSSYGWNNCDSLKEEVNVIDQNIKHKGWGKYEGFLIVKTITNNIDTIEFDCFSPNYKKGNWLNK